MKKILAATIILSQIFLVAFNTYAAVKLPTPSWVRWSSSTKGMATWEPVEDAEGEYGTELYRDGELAWHAYHLKRPKESWNWGHGMDQSGTYTFRVKAYGDYENFDDSEWSDLSEPYVYEKPELEFDAVRHVRWLGNGVVAWDPPLSVPSGCADDLAYEVRLYTDGVGDCAQLYVENTRQSMLNYMTEDDAVYYASVRALSKNIERIANGPSVFTDQYLDTRKIGQEISKKLRYLLDDLKTGEESPSNAGKKLEEMGLENVAVAVQANSGARSQLERLEKWYMDNTGTNVDIIAGEDTGLNPEDVRVIGAGLNVASPSNAVRVNISKPENNVSVNPKIYKNLVQFDINLDGANGEELLSPIVLIMPVPKGVKGSRLWILHHHQDGSYETIYPTLIENNTKVRFTVTSLSVFSFVTDPDETDDSGSVSDVVHYSSSDSSSDSEPDAATERTVWVEDKNGWWLKNPDGTWPQNQWVQAYWNGKKDWYFFDQSGYMATGWIDWDGKRYYLYEIPDGTLGHMVTGWQCIKGIWYYFDFTGALVVNTKTPDGYLVDESGAWIQ